MYCVVIREIHVALAELKKTDLDNTNSSKKKTDRENQESMQVSFKVKKN